MQPLSTDSWCFESSVVMLAWLINLFELNTFFVLRNPETQKILWKISELSQKSENGGTKKFKSVLCHTENLYLSENNSG